MSAYAKPLPSLDAANRPFFEGARRRAVVVQACLDCGRQRFPAARICAHCRSERSEWVETSPRGVVESFCVFHRAYWPAFQDEIPYAVIQVRLDGGVRLFSNLVGLPPDRVRSGMRVVATFEDATPEVTLVKFVPEP